VTKHRCIILHELLDGPTKYYDGRFYLSVYVDFGRESRDSVLLCWRCDTLCTSGFVDDIMISYNGPIARRVLRGRQCI